MNQIVENGLSKVFPNAVVHVDHDLVACAYATYLGRPGISCIIGTGSNSCYFDGKVVSEEVPALGYILGDEGSGSYFGKKLLAAYLYHNLPSHLSADFEEMYGLDKEAIVDKVYREPNANVFIASFMPFIAKHSDEPFFQAMIEAGLKHFMEVHVCCYSNYKSVDIHFVGSLAGIFRAALDRAAASLGISVTSVVRKPVEGLVNYHLKYILKDKITQG
jgi:N-acetylglucosamine kinase-like BadF-type ATPase